MNAPYFTERLPIDVLIYAMRDAIPYPEDGSADEGSSSGVGICTADDLHSPGKHSVGHDMISHV
jgi:hypothetical protein